MVPSNSVNSPRTVAMPMCLTAKPTVEWAGSTVQVPVGIKVAGAMSVAMRMPRVRRPAGGASRRHSGDCRSNYITVKLCRQLHDEASPSHLRLVGALRRGQRDARQAGHDAKARRPVPADGAAHVAGDAP